MSKAAIFSTIGAGVGFVVGGPPGAALGASLGMAAGGQMDEGDAQSAVMRQNAQIAERDAIVQRQTAEYNAQVLEMEARQAEQIAAYNAQVLENEALAREQRAKFQRDAASRDAKRLRGEQASLYGFSGVQLTGSAIVVEADSEFMAEANEANIMSLGEIEAYKFRQQATMQNYQAGIEAGRYRSGASETIRQGTIAGQALTAQAGVSKYQAGATKTAGLISAGSTILGGAAKIGNV